MKRTILILLLIGPIKIFAQTTFCEGVISVPQVTFNQCNTDPWKLVFEEDFDAPNLNLDVWNYGGDEHIRYCNGEQQYYTNGDNIELSNGTLKLIAKNETVYAEAVDWKSEYEHLYCEDGEVDVGQNLRFFYYTSGNIQTNRKFSNGMFEARVKIPKGKGFWPAFWVYAGDPVYNEIDIFEFWTDDNLNNLSKVHHMTVHYDLDGDGEHLSCGTNYTGVDFSQDFHIFKVIWDENKISWYVDGILKRTDYKYYTNLLGQGPIECTLTAWQQYAMNAIFPQDPMSIILNFAIQDGDDAPDGTTSFPSQMEVDWVKYYQRIDVQDINITSANQFLLSEELYNVMYGESVSINCSYTIPDDQQLEVIATNGITIGAGFNAELGSFFCARIAD